MKEKKDLIRIVFIIVVGIIAILLTPVIFRTFF